MAFPCRADGGEIIDDCGGGIAMVDSESACNGYRGSQWRPTEKGKRQDKQSQGCEARHT